MGHPQRPHLLPQRPARRAAGLSRGQPAIPEVAGLRNPAGGRRRGARRLPVELEEEQPTPEGGGRLMDPTDQEFAGTAETGEQTDVMGLHAPMMREQEEPKDGLEVTPFWLLVVIGAILLWGGYYLGEHTGGFRGDDLDQGPPVADLPVKELTPLEYGRRQYNGNCAACHGTEGTGQGKPDGCPPLAGAEWVVGTGAGSQARLARIVLHGLTGP